MKKRTREQASNGNDTTQTTPAVETVADMQVVDTCIESDNELARYDVLLRDKNRSRRKKKNSHMNPLEANHSKAGMCAETAKVDSGIDSEDALPRNKKRSKKKKKDSRMSPLEENYSKAGFCVKTDKVDLDSEITQVDLDTETTKPELGNEFSNVEEAPYRPCKKMKLQKKAGLDSEISQPVLDTANVEEAPKRSHKQKLQKKVDLDIETTKPDLDNKTAKPDLDNETAKVEEALNQPKKKKKLRRKVDLDLEVTQGDLDMETTKPDLDNETAMVEEALNQPKKKKKLRKKVDLDLEVTQGDLDAETARPDLDKETAKVEEAPKWPHKKKKLRKKVDLDMETTKPDLDNEIAKVEEALNQPKKKKKLQKKVDLDLEVTQGDLDMETTKPDLDNETAKVEEALNQPKKKKKLRKKVDLDLEVTQGDLDAETARPDLDKETAKVEEAPKWPHKKKKLRKKVDLDMETTKPDLDNETAKVEEALNQPKKKKKLQKKVDLDLEVTQGDLDMETTKPDLDNETAKVEEALNQPKKKKLRKKVDLDLEVTQGDLDAETARPDLDKETAKVEEAPKWPHKKKKLRKKVDLGLEVTQVDLDTETARSDLDNETAKVEEAPNQPRKKKNLRKKHRYAEVHSETAKDYGPEQCNSLLGCNLPQQDSFPLVDICSKKSSEITESSAGAHSVEAISGKGENYESCNIVCTSNKDVESVTFAEGHSRKKERKRKKQNPSSKIFSATAKVHSPVADNSLIECTRLLGDALQPINKHSEKNSELTESNEDVQSWKEIDKENNILQCCICSSSNKDRDSAAISEGSSVKKKKRKRKKMNQTTDVMKDNNLFVHVKALGSPTLVDSSLPDGDVSVPCPFENGNFSELKMDLSEKKISDGQSQLENLLRSEDAVIDAKKEDLMPCSSLAGATSAEAGLTITRDNFDQTLCMSHSKKKLLVLDINGLLADIVSQGRHVRKPDTIVSRKAVFKRPFCDDFLRFCFDRFDVGIWSSRIKKNVDKVLDFLMGNLRDKLLFCWDQSHCTHTKFNTLENAKKPLVLKELRKLWEKCEPDLPWERGWYNESNTILLDDSPYKALRNPAHTAVFPHSYCYQHSEDSSLGPGGDLRVYLEGLSSAADVQEYVRQNPFGQQAITKSNPAWKFYSKIIQPSSCKLNKAADHPDRRDKVLID